MAQQYQSGFARFLNITLLILKVRVQVASIHDVYKPCIVAYFLCFCNVPSPTRKSIRHGSLNRWSNRYVSSSFWHSRPNQLLLHVQYGPCRVALPPGQGTVIKQSVTGTNHSLGMQGLLHHTACPLHLRLRSPQSQGHTNLLYRPRVLLGPVDSSYSGTKYWLLIFHLWRLNQTCKNLLHRMNLCRPRFLLPHSPSPSLGRLTAQRE